MFDFSLAVVHHLAVFSLLAIVDMALFLWSMTDSEVVVGTPDMHH
jgi:hypothetical protein